MSRLGSSSSLILTNLGTLALNFYALVSPSVTWGYKHLFHMIIVRIESEKANKVLSAILGTRSVSKAGWRSHLFNPYSRIPCA